MTKNIFYFIPYTFKKSFYFWKCGFDIIPRFAEYFLEPATYIVKYFYNVIPPVTESWADIAENICNTIPHIWKKFLYIFPDVLSKINNWISPWFPSFKKIVKCFLYTFPQSDHKSFYFVPVLH